MHGGAARRPRGGFRSICVEGFAVLLLAGSLGALAPLAAPAAAQAIPATFEQGIFELRVGRASAETMPGLLSASGTILLPIDRVIALTEIPMQRTDSSRTIERARGAGSATLFLTSRRIVGSTGTTSLSKEELVTADGVVYLAATRIAEFLRATIESDLGQLTVTLTRSPPFPVEQNAARAQRTAAGTGHAGTGATPSVPFVARSGGAVLDWNVATVGTGHSLSGTSGNVRMAAALFGGDITGGVGVSGSGLGGSSGGDAQWSYRRGLPDNQLVRTIEVGDILAGGTQVRSIKGLAFSNARLVADPLFGSVPIDVDLPQGWQYEVYQDGQLVGFSDPGRRGPLYVPLRYGNTPLQVRLVGPTGDETIRDYNYLVPQTQQQPGRLEYNVGIGRCVSYCESTAFGDLSYGLLPWLSVSGGAERQVVDGATSFRPEGGVSLLSYTGWYAQMEAARASFERASVLYAGLGRIAGSASYTRTYASAAQPSVLADAVSSRWLFNGLLQLRPSEAAWASGWRLDNSLEGAASGSVERMRTVLTMDRARGNVGVSYETDRSRDLREAGVSTLAVLTYGTRAASLLGTLLFDTHAVHALELSTSLQTGVRGAIAITTRWQRGAGPQLSVGYNGALGALRIASRLAASSRGGASVATTASGSVATEGVGTPTLFEGPGVGLAGVSGRVFYDVDGDGRFGAGDLPVPGIRIVVSGTQTRSDSSGMYHAWNVVPYEPVDVSIDTLALRDPSWTLQRGRTVMRATPGMFNRVDFPLVRTRELAGQLVADSGVVTAGGVSLLLTPEGGGTAIKLLTFSDGSFYLSRVRPGRYTLTVSGAALDALAATADPATTTLVVTTSADEPVLDVPVIHLRPKAPVRPSP